MHPEKFEAEFYNSKFYLFTKYPTVVILLKVLYEIEYMP